MSSKEYARRLVRELQLPDQADFIVQRKKYWRPAFCLQYMQRSDELSWEVPEDGLVAAEVCPELVSLTEKETRRPQDRLRLKALVVCGNAYRAVGELERAGEVFRAAFGLVKDNESTGLLRRDLAWLLGRFSYLLCAQGRVSSAVRVADQSIASFRTSPAEIRRRYLGEALLTGGFVRRKHGELAEAMKMWAETLVWTDPKVSSRVFFTASHNLALAMMFEAIPARDLGRVERSIAEAVRLLRRRSRCIARLTLRWLLAILRMRLGSVRRGEATCRRVIDDSVKADEVVHAMLARVTLASQLQREDRHGQLRRLVMGTHEGGRLLAGQGDVRRAVLLLKETVEAGTVSRQVVATVWRLLECRAFERVTGLCPEMSAAPPRISSCRTVGDVDWREIA